jgi:hypothetical protein
MAGCYVKFIEQTYLSYTRCGCGFDVSVYKATQYEVQAQVMCRWQTGKYRVDTIGTCPLSNAAMVIGAQPSGSASSPRRIIYGTGRIGGHHRKVSATWLKIVRQILGDCTLY